MCVNYSNKRESVNGEYETVSENVCERVGVGWHKTRILMNGLKKARASVIQYKYERV